MCLFTVHKERSSINGISERLIGAVPHHEFEERGIAKSMKDNLRLKEHKSININ